MITIPESTKSGRTHEVVDLLQLAHADGLERSPDETAAEEVDGFRSVLSVSDVGSFDGDHFDDLMWRVSGRDWEVQYAQLTDSKTGARR